MSIRRFDVTQNGQPSHLHDSPDGKFVLASDYDAARAALAKREAVAVPDVPSALKVISDAMKADPDFAWSWHCNVAMTAQDAGAPHDRANVWAANFMRRAFDVDTLTRVNAELLAASQQAAKGDV
jgi:hypothetical protein